MRNYYHFRSYTVSFSPFVLSRVYTESILCKDQSEYDGNVNAALYALANNTFV